MDTANANLNENAIWVPSYPKSGNTWMMLSLQAAFLDGWLDDLNSTEEKGPHAADIRNFEEALDIDPSDLRRDEIMRWRPEVLELLAQRLTQPSFFKLHDHAQVPDGRWLTPMEKTRAVLHLVRDPRDIVISWAHHSNLTLDQSIDFLCMDDAYLAYKPHTGLSQLPQFIGNWSANCQSWLDAAKHAPTLTLRYEDRLSSPEETLRQTLSFIGLEKPDEVIQRILNVTSFKNLRQMENKNHFSAKPPMMNSFFRKGKSGDWKNTLSDKQVARIEFEHGQMMKKLAYI